MDNAMMGMSHYLYKKLKGNGTQNMGNLVLEIFTVLLKFHHKVNLYKISREFGKSDRYNGIGNSDFFLVLADGVARGEPEVPLFGSY